MSLPTLPKVQELQAALHAKAKESSDYRFYTLYDKVYRKDVLWVAYRRSLINGGAPGVDGQTFEDIEQYGAQRWRDELVEKPTGPWTATPGIGSATGCVVSTGCRSGNTRISPIHTCTTTWACPGSPDEHAAFRGRKRESLSESRMREICTSGSMSGRWRSTCAAQWKLAARP